MRYPNGGSDPTGTRRYGRLLAALMAVCLIAAACGGDDGGNGGGADIDGEGLSGEIVISGSSTVEPISIGVAERFAEIAPDVNVAVDGPGTGDGFEVFCQGDTDISDASRAIAEEEIAACEEAGIEFIEMKVAIDGLSVLTSPENEEIGDCLSFSDIYAIVGPESQGFNQWSAANAVAAEVGANQGAPFADVPLAITGPGEESGTYDSFVEIVLEDIAEEREQEAQTRPDYQASAEDNVIVQGIQGSETSFGWVGYAFFEANQDSLKAFEIAGEDGECVAPNAETIADGSYPIARALFIYANVEKLDSNPALGEFLELYLSDDGLAAATDVGYVNLPDEEIEATREAFENRSPGTREG